MTETIQQTGVHQFQQLPIQQLSIAQLLIQEQDHINTQSLNQVYWQIVSH